MTIKTVYCDEYDRRENRINWRCSEIKPEQDNEAEEIKKRKRRESQRKKMWVKRE